jgi:hypothetical protein
MAWIELHDSVYESLKTQRLARALDVQVELAVGLLGRLWHWGLRDAEHDGQLPEATADEVAFICRWFGDANLFVSALIKAKFLEEAGGRYVIPNWHQYGGKLTLRKEANAKKNKALRDRMAGVTVTNASRDGHVTDTCESRDGHVTVTCRARGEERREEENTHVCSEPGTHDAPTPTQTTDKPKKATYPKDFEAFWVAYPDRRRREKPDAYKAWVKVTGEYTVAQVMAALEVSKRSVDWTKDGGEFVPMPGRWLRRLDPDDVTASPEIAVDVPEPFRGKPWVFHYVNQPGSIPEARVATMVHGWGYDYATLSALVEQLGTYSKAADELWRRFQEKEATHASAAH